MRLNIEGNNGGSYVTITELKTKGMVHLEVGETCVHTVDQNISVSALAAILTWAKDEGFQKIVDSYLSRGGGSPAILVTEDAIVTARKRI
jgi:hypothetical protein